MIRLLADNAFPSPVIFELRHLGHDILGLEETGRLSRWSSDNEVLAVARDTGRVLLTLDHKSFTKSFTYQTFPHSPHPGVIICTFDRNFVGLANRIHVVLLGRAGLDGQVIRIGRQRTVFA